MKISKLLLIMLLVMTECYLAKAQINYYPTSTTNLNLVANWNDHIDGLGNPPANFTASNQVFNMDTTTGSIAANWTVSGTNSKIVIGDGINAANFSTGSFTVTGTVDVSNLGLFTVQSSTSPFTVGTMSAGSTVDYAMDASQSVRAGTYDNLTLSNATAARTKSASGNISVNGALNVGVNNTLAMTTFLLSGSLTSIAGSGTISTFNTSLLPIPSGKTWTQTVNYAAATSNVSGGTYENLTITTAGTKTARGNIIVNNTLNSIGTAATILAMSTFTLSGGFTNVGVGTISTANTSATPFPSGKTWPGTVSYSAAGNQTIVDGTYTNLSVSGGGSFVKSVTANLTVTGTLTTAASTILDLVTFQLLSTTTITNTGTIRTQNTSATPLIATKTYAGTIEYNGGSNQTVVNAIYTNLNLTGGDRTLSSSDTIKISGTFTTGAGVFTSTGSTVALNGTTTQIINAGGQTFNNFAIILGTTKRIASAGFNVDGELNVPSGRTLAMTTFPLSGSLTSIAGSGTISTFNTSLLPIPSGKTWTQTVNYAAATSNVSGGTYENLTISTAGTKTARGNIIVNNTLSSIGTATTILAMSTFTLSGGFTNVGVGTISTANTSATPLPSGVTWTQTVTYFAAGNQTIMAGTYQNLSVIGSGTKPAEGNIEVNDVLTVTTAIFNMNVFELSGSFTNASNGSIQTGNTTATPLPAGKTWTQTVAYNSASSQTIVNGQYVALDLTGGDRVLSSIDSIRVSGTFTAGAGIYTPGTSNFVLNGTGSQSFVCGGQTFYNFSISLGSIKTVNIGGFNVNGELHVISSATLAMGTFQLGGILASTSGTGSVTTTHTGASPLPNGVTWAPSVTYSAATQNVALGIYNNLTITTTGNKTALGDITVNGTLNVSATLDMSTFLLDGTLSTISGVGTITTWNTTATPIPSGKDWTQNITYSSASAQTVVDGTYNLDLNVAGGNRTFSNLGNINIGRTFTANTGAAVYTTTGSTIVFTSAAAQTITLAANFPFNNVSFTGGNTKTIGVSIFVNGVINIASGNTLNIVANTLSGATLTTSGAGLLRTQSVSATPIPSAKTWSFRLQFDANGNQTIPIGTYSGGLYGKATSGIRTRTLAGVITVGDTLSITTTFAILVLNGNTLVLNGIINPAETGTITGSAASSITIGSNPDDAGTLNMTQTSTDTRSLNNLTVSRASGADAIILGNELRLIGVLTLTDGTLAANGNLVFVSSAIATSAQLDVVTGTGNVSGNVVVQRFIDGQPVSTNERWRFLASSVTTSNGIDDNWQKQVLITGAGTGGTLCPAITANSNGFDPTPSNRSSFYTRNAATDTWLALPNTNATELQTGIGYRVFYRGSRLQNCDSIFAGTLNPSDTTLVATGTLAIGTQILTGGAAANRYSLVGNPFQATIDLESPGISFTNLSSTISTFRPNTAIGTYGYYTIGGIAVNGMSRYISPGQSFWIQTVVAAASSMSIAESAKTVAQGGYAFFKTQPAEQNVLRIKLFKSSSTDYLDEVAVVQKANANWSYNVAEEAMKIGFSTDQMQLYTPDDSTKYAICVVPGFDVLHNRINIDAKTIVGNDYSINFTGVTSFDATLGFTLYDSYLGKTQDLRVNPVYSFATPDAASILATRFYILFDPNATSLPVNLIAFSAERTSQNQTALTWKTASEQGSDRFDIERSVDAKTFVKIGTTKAAKQSSKVVNYMFTDISPVLTSTNYYRLKQVDANGAFAYSQLVSVSYKQAPTLSAANVSVYPVPANDVLVVEVKDKQLLQNATIKMYDLFGKELSLPIEYVTGKWTIQTTELNKGMYIVTLLNNGAITQFKVLKD
jgi:hypothetical protein